MFTPELIAISGLILSSTIFYLYARGVNKEKLTLDGFMLYDRGLSKSQFGNTLAASCFSLAMSVTFYFFSHPLYGLFMLVSPISYISGQYFFVWLVKQSRVDFSQCRTISDLCYKLYPSKSVARLITIMTLSTFIMVVFVELYIGTIVLTVFLPDEIIYKTLSFLGLGLLVLMYVRLGGYKALVRTDKWQLTLMLMSVILIFTYSVFAPAVNGADVGNILLNTLHYKEDNWPLLGFVVWLCTMNFLMPFTQISYWQRIAASKSADISLKGLIYSSWKLFILFLCPMLGFILLTAKGYTFEAFPEFLQTIKNTNWISGYIVFPLLVVGFCSMTFSSADTAVIAITYTLSDKNTFLRHFSNMDENKLRRTLVILISLILLILVVIYWLQYTGLQGWLMPLIYTACGQLTVLVPLPLFILIQLARGQEIKSINVTKKNTFLLFNSIILAWVILIINTYLSKTTGSQLWMQISVPVGALIISCVTWKIYKPSVLARKVIRI